MVERQCLLVIARLHGIPELDAEARGGGQDGRNRVVGTGSECRVQ
jgi:hypothetical protein